MMLAGLDIEQVKLFGRWRSTAQCLRYLRDTAINTRLIEKYLKNKEGPTATRVQQANAENEASTPKPRSSKRWSELRVRRR